MIFVLNGFFWDLFAHGEQFKRKIKKRLGLKN